MSGILGNMKKVHVFLIALFACAALAAVEHPFAGLGIEDYRITSAWPESFREVSGSVEATINNSGTRRVVRNIRANVYRNGTAFASGKCSDVTFTKGRSKYTLNGRVKLADGVSVWNAIKAAFSFNPSEYVVEVSMVMTHENGETETIVRKVPVTRFLNR